MTGHELVDAADGQAGSRQRAQAGTEADLQVAGVRRIAMVSGDPKPGGAPRCSTRVTSARLIAARSFRWRARYLARTAGSRTDCAQYSLLRSSSARYDPSCPVIPVMSAFMIPLMT